MQFTCVFCGYEMEKDLPGPIDTIVCPSCRTKMEIMQENSTVLGETILFVRILKEGKKKGE
jgi:hypothetical protein